MTEKQINRLIAESPGALQDALTEQVENINTAVQMAVDEATENDSKIKPISIGLKITIDLNGSSPKAAIESRVGIVHRFIGDTIDLDDTIELEPGMGKGRKGAV